MGDNPFSQYGERVFPAPAPVRIDFTLAAADDIREELAEVIRLQKIGPFGPNTLALISNGKAQTHLTRSEADDIADAILESLVIARIRAEAQQELRTAILRRVHDDGTVDQHVIATVAPTSIRSGSEEYPA